MNDFITYLAYGIVGGPALALSHGLGLYTPLFCFLTLSAAYIISVVILNLLLSTAGLEARFQNRILRQVDAMLKKRGKELALKMDEVALKFTGELGDLGFYLALASFTFVFGVYWAALAAYILRMNLWRSTASISVGAVLSVGFWTYLSLRHNLDPKAVTLFFLAATLLFMAYGYAKQNKAVLKVSDRILSEIGKIEKSFKA